MDGYVVVESFNKDEGEAWRKYIEFSKLDHIEEVVTLDCLLCPDITEKDKSINRDVLIYSNAWYNLVNDLEYIIGNYKLKLNKNILAIWKDPPKNCREKFKNDKFEFCGFDLIDEDSGISAILNCGGFDKVFTNKDISNIGLIQNYGRAKEIQINLENIYPEDEHAFCELIAIWRLKEIK